MHVKYFTKPATVEVTYISTHTNHAVGIQECKYLPLPLSVRKDIQEKFSQGVTLERIMSGKYMYICIIILHRIKLSFCVYMHRC